MAIGENFEEFARQIAARMDGTAERVGRAVELAFDRAGERWKSAMVGGGRGRLVLDGGKGKSEPLATRSGLLSSKFYVRRTEGSGLSTTMVMGNSALYARVQEYGTLGAGGELPDIVPVTAKALTIPLPAAMTGSGIPKEPSARAWPDTFLWINEDNPNADTLGYIVREDPSSPGDLEFLYRLALRVAIPPRLGMRRTFESQREQLDRDLAKAIEEGLA